MRTSPGGQAVEGSWRDLPVRHLALEPRDLDLAATLDCGQAFRWRLGDDGWWRGVIGDCAVRIRRAGEACEYQVFPCGKGPRLCSVLTSASTSTFPVSSRVWPSAARRSRPALRAHPGIRILAQPPEETLLSFLCSPANSVPRISRSIEQLCARHGRPIAVLDGADYRAFPSAATLAGLPDFEFRAVGLGWRGLGIQAVAERLLFYPPDWLMALRAAPHGEARAALTEFPYVGPKIADCVCLFGLLKDEAVPVDTHVWALAKDLFANEAAAGGLTKSLTAKTYDRVVALYQERYGPCAGWAQQYLYHWRRNGCPE